MTRDELMTMVDQATLMDEDVVAEALIELFTLGQSSPDLALAMVLLLSSPSKTETVAKLIAGSTHGPTATALLSGIFLGMSMLKANRRIAELEDEVVRLRTEYEPAPDLG